MIDAVVDSPKDKLVTVNQLLIPALPRSYFGATLECRVTSMEVAGSVSKEVAITVYCKYFFLKKMHYLCRHFSVIGFLLVKYLFEKQVQILKQVRIIEQQHVNFTKSSDVSYCNIPKVLSQLIWTTINHTYVNFHIHQKGLIV